MAAAQVAVVEAVIGADWPRRWPCSGFRPGDQVEARFDGRGDLVGVECWRGGSLVYPLDVEAAELGAALATYGAAV